MNWFLPLYVLGLYGLVRYVTKPKEELKRGKVNWDGLEATSITLFIYFGAQILAGILLLLYGLLRSWDSSQLSLWADSSVVAQFAFVLLVESVTVFLLYKFLKRRQADFKTIGLVKPRWADIAYALIGFAVYFGLLIVSLQIFKALVPSLDIDQQQQIGFENAHGLSLAVVFISLVVLPPLVEELLIRGFLYSGLKKSLPKIWAMLAASALFGIAHLQAGSGEKLLWVAAIDTFVLSMVLIYLKDKTNSLWAPIFLHTIKNGLAFLALFVFASSLFR